LFLPLNKGNGGTNKTHMKNLNQIHALKTKLAGMRDDLYTLVWSEADQSIVVQQQAKIRALKTKITRLENQPA